MTRAIALAAPIAGSRQLTPRRLTVMPPRHFLVFKLTKLSFILSKLYDLGIHEHLLIEIYPFVHLDPMDPIVSYA